jgi:hypothetical protein
MIPNTPNFTSLGSRTVLAVLCALFTTSTVRADCFWKVPNKLTIEQSNGYSPVLTLKENERQIRGSAVYADHETGRPIHGIVAGTLRGNKFDMEIEWNTAPVTVGSYSGYVKNRFGLLEGETHDKRHTLSTASWAAREGLVCGRRMPQ